MRVYLRRKYGASRQPRHAHTLRHRVQTEEDCKRQVDVASNCTSSCTSTQTATRYSSDQVRGSQKLCSRRNPGIEAFSGPSTAILKQALRRQGTATIPISTWLTWLCLVYSHAAERRRPTSTCTHVGGRLEPSGNLGESSAGRAVALLWARPIFT